MGSDKRKKGETLLREWAWSLKRCQELKKEISEIKKGVKNYALKENDARIGFARIKL